ncbi:MAG: T9SS type A sorting domain-containing protein, partial [Flavobacteriaceae bacterium]|nr:T9SS type A sorting domain-containing protein [Flavobacteriaceae bacterium]
VNLDSYTGVFCQNYYIYKSESGHYLPIMWDLNMAFGGFPFAGSSNSSMAALSATQMEQMPLGLHSTDVHWPLIKAIQANPTWKRMYAAHIKTLTTEFFTNNNYQTLASKYAALIDAEVKADSNKFYSYSQFQQSMTAGVNIGTYTVPGISILMSARDTFLQTTTEFTSQQPTIGAASFSKSNPKPNEQLTVITSVSNAVSGVYFYYRFAKFEPFEQAQLFDDGNHADGAAADGVYGGEITMKAYTCHYYLYAENGNAGIFSPKRAAHEFYTFGVAPKVAKQGEVVLNEFLAQNQNDSTTAASQHEDWIELANITSNDLLLDSLYLTDDFMVPDKYIFSANTVIHTHGYLMLWADGNTQAGAEIHCGFKLSASGEQLMLSNASGQVYDSLSFGEQKVDTSLGRCYKNGWKWEQLPHPTAGKENQCWPLSVATILPEYATIFPNPANDILYIHTYSNLTQNIQVRDVTGRLVFSEKGSGQLSIYTFDWAIGIYFLQVGNSYHKFAVVH